MVVCGNMLKEAVRSSQELGKESLSPPAYFAGVNGFYLLAACCVLSNGGGGLKQSLPAQ